MRTRVRFTQRFYDEYLERQVNPGEVVMDYPPERAAQLAMKRLCSFQQWAEPVGKRGKGYAEKVSGTMKKKGTE